MVRLGFGAAGTLAFAHRAFCARLIFLRAAADRVCRPLEFELPRAASAAPNRRTSVCALSSSFFKCRTKLTANFATNTELKGYWLPAIRAAIELDGKHPDKAIDLLEPASAYELGQPGPVFGTLYPVYIRGEAYLQQRQGQRAAAEFQKLINHRGIVANFVLGALAHLQLGRAYAMSGDTVKALAAYKDFLTLWKDADPDIPILKQAKAEYAKLQ
jgi:hypothetical protein